jgi:hypothetical protein
MTTNTMRGRRTKMTTVVRSWEEKEGGGSAKKNQICHHRHHWDKGGREDLMIATPGRDDTHANSAT